METINKVVYNKFEDKSRGSVMWDVLNPLRYTQCMSMSRAKILMEGYKETEGYHFFRRRGHTLRKILQEMPIRIDDHQLLCGDFSAKPMGPEFFPDLAALWIVDYIDNYGVEGRKGFFRWENEEQMELGREIGEYFRETGGKEQWIKFLGEEEAAFEHKIGEAGSWIVNTVSEMFAEKAWNCPDLDRLVKRGARALIADIDEQLEKSVLLSYEDYRSYEFWRGLKEMLLGVIDYAHRYRDLALELAAKESDPVRKAELEEMARVCNRVPEYPAETFQESLQSLVFGILMVFYDTRTFGMGYGRIDQILYPGYKADIASGKIDDEYVVQLFECFRVKIMGKRQFWPDVMTPNLSSESHFHNCVIGGVDPKTGRDATNELSFAFLEAAERVRTTHPTISVRWHTRINPKFMKRALETVKLGMGFPAFFNDETSIQYLLARGYTIEEARNYAFGGCTLHTVPGKTSSIWPLVTSYGRILELTMYNGWDHISNSQLGPQTGDFTKMTSYEEFVDAYKSMIKYWADVSTKSGRAAKLQHGDTFPDMAMSAFTDNCIDRGRVCSLGGAEHADSCMYIVPVAVQDVANELYVIKHGIFGEHPICTPQEMLNAMRANWEGYEELRAKCKAMPKYGNDIPAVDQLLTDVYDWVKKIWHAQPATDGGHYEVSPHSIGFHGGTGAKTGALPCGRKAGTSFSDGAVSPVQGTDINGPSAVLKSAGSIDQHDLYGVLFNMRFSPSNIKGDEGTANIAALIKTYFSDYKGKHIQFNVLNPEQLRAAKEEPEKYKDLMVRVAGYSAYWTDLPANIQDELIARTEHEL
ncbi:pyruvate formate lyase family protein [Shewanella sp. GXUN23E]|uniref:pyruvate formate lyase family protein n=1 Tax=Shewanella sp. GXUN23E TaxID=3422498 RepID=UPI003D7CFEB8